MTAKLKKIRFIAPLVLSLILLLAPSITRAQWWNPFSLTDLAYSVIGKVFFFISWLMSLVAGVAIAVEAWILGFILEINTQIVNSPPVAVGFPIALSIANLALVFAIIVIAIMTILRMQTYGIKQTLWKLIVMAIAINFGLVIAGAILQFFDSLSFYFLNSVNPAGAPGQDTNFTNFASALAGAFNPQKFMLDAGINEKSIIGRYQDQVSGAGEDIGKLVTPITATLFTVFALIFIIITLGALIVMLIIRYVSIAYLLILLPLAWVSWIFPATKNHWDKWWRNFLNQAAFAPIVLFFLWIGIQTSYALSAGVAFKLQKSYVDPATNTIFDAVSRFFKELFEPVIAQLLNTSVLLGIMIGGLFAAKNMGIKFADAATGAAMGSAAWFGKGVGRWSARKGMQAGTAVARGARGRKLATRLQTGKVLSRLPGAKVLGGGLERLAVAGSERAVKLAEKNIEGMTDDQVANGMSRFDAPTRWAALQRLHKNNALGKIKNIDRYLGEDKKAEAERYNLGEFFNQARSESGLHLRDLVRKLEKARGTAGEATAQEELSAHLRAAGKTGQLAKTFFVKDEAKLAEIRPLDMDVAEVRRLQEYIAKGLMEDFTGSNISAFIQEAARGDQLDVLEAAGRRALEHGVASQNRISVRFRRYVTSSAARSAGIDETTFGLGPGDTEPSRIITPPGAGEPRNVKSTTTFT